MKMLSKSSSLKAGNYPAECKQGINYPPSAGIGKAVLL